VLRSRQRNIDSQHALDIETSRYRCQADEARKKETRRNEQRSAQSHLESHQQIAQPQSAWSTGIRITRRFQRLVRRAGRGASKRRQYAEQQGGQGRKNYGESQHSSVNRDFAQSRQIDWCARHQTLDADERKDDAEPTTK